MARRVFSIVISLLYACIAVAKVRSIVTTVGAGHDARRLFIALHLASGAVFFAALAFVMLVRSPPLQRERRPIGWILPIGVMVLLSLLGLPEPSRHTPFSLIVVATALTLVGAAVTMVALFHLGRNFGVVADVRGMATSGLYRWVRHPLYAGELCTTLGLVLAIARPVTVALFVAGTGLQLWRAKVEEQALRGAIPGYADYARRTPMLVPGWHRTIT